MASLGVVTYNALHPKYAHHNLTAEQLASEEGRNRVASQAEMLAGMICGAGDVVCVQEASDELRSRVAIASCEQVHVVGDAQVCIMFDSKRFTLLEGEARALAEWLPPHIEWAETSIVPDVRAPRAKLLRRAEKGKDAFARALLRAASGHHVHICTAHLPVMKKDGGEDDTEAQTLVLSALVRAWSDACSELPASTLSVLCGDFNVCAGSAPYAAVFSKDRAAVPPVEDFIAMTTLGGVPQPVSVVRRAEGKEHVTTRARRVADDGKSAEEPPFVATLDYIVARADDERAASATVSIQQDPTAGASEEAAAKAAARVEWPALKSGIASDHVWLRAAFRL